MISIFRNFAKSPWAAGLLVLVMLSFVVVGMKADIFGAMGPRNVISAGSRSVGMAEFSREFGRVRDNLQQQSGRPLTVEDLVNENIHQRYLEDRTRLLGFLDWAWRAGIRPGQELILKQIRAIPAFFNSVTGQFDEQNYRQVLAQQGITPEDFENQFRDDYIGQHFASAIGAGPRLPRVYGALVANQALENRDARWFVVTQAMAGTAGTPTDAQLTTFLNENAAQLRRPETRTLSLVLFTDESAPAVTDAAIQERFNFRKDELSAPETRTFVVLTAPDRAGADRIAAALRAGQSPEEAGRAAGIQPSPYNDTPRAAISDPAVAAAVFGLTVGQVSDPIQGRVGFSVARLSGVTPGREARLEDVRDQIVEELQTEARKDQTYKRVEAYDAARGQGKTMEEAAAIAGARIRTLGPVTQDGQTLGGRLNAPPLIFSTAWSLGRGGESEVVDAGQGQYFALRVDEIAPAALPSLDEVREPLARQWVLRENSRLLTTKAEQLAGRVRGGEDIAAVAASVGAPLVSRTRMLQNQETQQAVGEGVLRGVFSQDKEQAFAMAQSESAFVVGRVDRIRAPAAADAAAVALQVGPRMEQDVFQGVIEETLTAAGERTGARYDVNLARQALGVAPAAATPQPTK